MKKLYSGGAVLTMEGPGRAEAVLTENGRIVRAGTEAELRTGARGAQRVDLEGRTMLPAFIDPHSHLSSYASSFLQVSLEQAESFEDIEESIRSFIRSSGVKPGEWIVANDYDNNALREKRHPALALLDAAAPVNPLFIQHASGHAGVMNTAALDKLSITPETPAPEGGRIGAEDGRLTGYVEENAFFAYLKKVPQPDPAAFMDAYSKAQASYAAHGIATVQEGMAVREMLPLYRALLAADLLFLDLVAYPAVSDARAFTDAFPKACRGYDGHFRIGGLKTVLDGSPQARTAWMRAPYAGEKEYRGYPALKDEAVAAAFDEALALGMQLLAHCNGDAAAAQFIRAALDASARGDVRALRPVMIHAQLLAPDQLDDMKRAGIMASFFPGHIYRWGDTHIKNLAWSALRASAPPRPRSGPAYPSPSIRTRPSPSPICS